MSDPALLSFFALLTIVIPAFLTGLTSIFLAWSARKESREERKEAREARSEIKEELKVTKEEIKVAKEDIKAVVAETATKVDQAGVQLATIKEDIVVVHTQTNSNLTEIKKQLQESLDDNRALRKERDEKAGAEGKADD